MRRRPAASQAEEPDEEPALARHQLEGPFRTPVAFYSGQEFPTADAALDAAKRAVAWLGDVVA